LKPVSRALDRIRVLDMNKNFLLVMLLISFSTLYAEDSPCKIEPPIDTEAKAWCAVDKILFVQSCISKHGFDRVTFDMDDFWYLEYHDKNPDLNSACSLHKFKVCKENGKIIYEDSAEHCEV